MVAAIGEYMKVKVHACVGGTAVREDLAILREGVHVVVGTPGELQARRTRATPRATMSRASVISCGR